MIVMKHEFEKWLKEGGYKRFTPGGAPSTISQYLSAIDKVMKLERLDNYTEVARSIFKLMDLYAEDGKKAKIGQQSNATVINAIRRFYNFLDECKPEIIIEICEKQIKVLEARKL